MYELLQVLKLVEETGLCDRLPKLQVKGYVGQDEWRMVVKTLQDFS